MRVVCFLVVLGSLLALCPTAIHARQPTSTAQVGLEKRLRPNIEEVVEHPADEASELIQRLTVDEHGDQPNIPEEDLNLRPGKPDTNALAARRLADLQLPDEVYLMHTADAFKDTLLALELEPLPSHQSQAYGDFFRIMVNSYQVWKRASTWSGAMFSIKDFGSSIIPAQFARDIDKFSDRMSRTSGFDRLLTPEELRILHLMTDILPEKMERAAVVLEKLESRRQAYAALREDDPISFPLETIYDDVDAFRGGMQSTLAYFEQLQRKQRRLAQQRYAQQNNGEGRS